MAFLGSLLIILLYINNIYNLHNKNIYNIYNKNNK